MKSLLNTILAVFAAVSVAACSKPASVESAEALAANPERLKDLRAQCKADHAKVGDTQCAAVAEATRQRFFGSGGPKHTPAISAPAAPLLVPAPKE